MARIPPSDLPFRSSRPDAPARSVFDPAIIDVAPAPGWWVPDATPFTQIHRGLADVRGQYGVALRYFVAAPATWTAILATNEALKIAGLIERGTSLYPLPWTRGAAWRHGGEEEVIRYLLAFVLESRIAAPGERGGVRVGTFPYPVGMVEVFGDDHRLPIYARFIGAR